jgi:hypothetical protein
MAISTYAGRANRAKLLYDSADFWMGIGRTTAWSTELAPPSPTVSATTLEEPIVYVKAEVVSLCKTINVNPDVTVRGQGYKYVATADAVAEFARFLYIRARFDPSEDQPYATFRQIAIFSNLEPTQAHSADLWLAPANVLDVGICEYIENNAPTVMNLNRQEVIQVIIEFR